MLKGRLRGPLRCRRVENRDPAHVAWARAEAELDGLVMRVEKDRERVANDPLAALAGFRDLRARQGHAEALHVAGPPVFVVHLGAVGLQPMNVFDFSGVNLAALEKMAPAKDRLRLAQ